MLHFSHVAGCSPSLFVPRDIRVLDLNLRLQSPKVPPLGRPLVGPWAGQCRTTGAQRNLLEAFEKDAIHALAIGIPSADH